MNRFDDIIAYRTARRQTCNRKRHLSLTTLEINVVRSMKKIVVHRKKWISPSLMALAATSLLTALSVFQSSINDDSPDDDSDDSLFQLMSSILTLVQSCQTDRRLVFIRIHRDQEGNGDDDYVRYVLLTIALDYDKKNIEDLRITDLTKRSKIRKQRK